METNSNGALVAQILLRLNAVTLSPEQPYTFTSGIKSPIYTDNRILISYPAERRIITRLLSEQILQGLSADKLDVVVGTATAGIPFSAWVADYLNKPMAYVRSDAKHHGKMQKIEGVVNANERAVIVEDLISTGKSVISTAEELRLSGLVVEHCFAIFNYQLKGTAENLREAGLNLFHICGLDILADTALAQGLITASAYNILLDWRESSGWKS